MFETAERGRKLSKREYEAQVPALRAGLLDAQAALRAADFPVVVVISGADGAGKGDTVKRLCEWLDPRGVETHVFGVPTDEERERPAYWRFWRALPPEGVLGIFFGSWYTDPIVRRAYRTLSRSCAKRELDRIVRFEETLAQDGALLLKFWFHLSKHAQRKRLERFESDRRTSWRVTPRDWKHYEMYDRFRRASERAVRRTETPRAPWIVVEAADDRYRDVTVGRTLLDALRRRLEATPTPQVAPREPHPPETAGADTVLGEVDLSRRLSRREYRARLQRAQGRLARLTRKAFRKGVSTVAVFEGWDASGKGGAIRRITGAIDAPLYRVIPIAAPTDEERAHHYLWRFWRHLPRPGRVTIYDRSWYGRVLVERVEALASVPEWKRAYREINEFEEQLAEHGIVLLKFWVHISPEEQLRRFALREATRHKRHKITAEDWRNRGRWAAYEDAVHEMVERTSTCHAPWTLVAGDDKRSARVEIAEAFAGRLRRAFRAGPSRPRNALPGRRTEASGRNPAGATPPSPGAS